MRFSETVKLARPELVISRRHEAWLEQERPYSTAALKFAAHQLAQEGRERKGTVSASSLGECQRYQQFIYLGMNKLAPTVQGLSRMQNGSFMHLRWQMEGLSEGWLKQAEVPVASEEYRLTGTMDGILYDDSILELKSINANGFSRINTFGPLVPHLFQMATYMLCSHRTKGVFLYECKDNQEYTEIAVKGEDLPLEYAMVQARDVWAQIEAQVLAEPLGKCIDREGYVYESCPFRDRCLQIRSWEDVA